MRPRFSIFIPVWNGSAWIGGAIESILAQSYAEWELVIGDNASTDDVQGAVSGYRDARIHLHRWSTHTDLCENFNRTMLLARHEWIQPLGVDDRLAPRCLETMAARIREASDRSARLSVVLSSARRVDDRGRTANAAYYGYRGPAKIPDGRHHAASWLQHSLSGVTPWNIGSVAFSREVIAEMGGLLRPEIGLCADIDVVLRAAAYGDVLYIDQPLMAFTVRADGDSQSRGFSERAWNKPLSPLGVALVSALSVHMERRNVSKKERVAVHRFVAQAQLQRAFQQRYCAGGHGRRGAVHDVMRSISWSPKTVLRPENLAYALGAVLLTRGMIERVRAGVLRRLYRNDFDTEAAAAASPASPATSAVVQAVATEKPRAVRGWRAVIASTMSWFG